MAVYARVSTRDKEQTPDTQLMRLRDYAQSRGWTIVREYVDIASANDAVHRTAWRQLNDDAVKKRFDAVLVFKLDRAFRSVKHMHDTLAVWELLGVGFLSAQEGFDTTTALGRLLLNLLASLAEFELELIRERVTAGMDRARRQGKHIGRPPITADPVKARKVRQAVDAVRTGRLSYRQAAKQAGVALSMLQKALKEGVS
ncbi:Resolvase domain protein [Sulfobacillus acidophilus DSM 10332]|uniref:Resolvase domain protein n=1 Tax=Sulfobacillus acidophilus (strain ATCC 700253 / DSM 10332 / NAL) TaxID=679936 RepID=G8TY51_SULAD|nr:Resolvase domain protein [Sulfobacillus acidophilus DSM 10332]